MADDEYVPRQPAQSVNQLTVEHAKDPFAALELEGQPASLASFFFGNICSGAALPQETTDQDLFDLALAGADEKRADKVVFGEQPRLFNELKISSDRIDQ